MVPTLIGVMLITFFLVRVTGDPARFVLGEMVSDEAIAAFRAEHGLDRPVFVQFMSFLSGILHGDFGTSIRHREPVLKLFLERVPATLQLGLTAYLVGVAVGVTAGILAAIKVGSFGDKAIRFLVLIGQSIPVFYLGLLLIIFVSLRLGWLPTGGRGGLRYLILPALALSARLIALVARFTRSVMLDVLDQDYVRTARSKGLSEGVVVWKHAARNAIIPLVTLLGLEFGHIISGAAVTETVFSWPGIGRFVISAISTRDYPVVQGTVLILTSIVVILNLAIDVSYAYLDPRIKYS